MITDYMTFGSCFKNIFGVQKLSPGGAVFCKNCEKTAFGPDFRTASYVPMQGQAPVPALSG